MAEDSAGSVICFLVNIPLVIALRIGLHLHPIAIPVNIAPLSWAR